MNSRYFQRMVIFVLVFALLGGLAGEAQPPIPASAQGIPPLNAAIALFNGITLTNKRNRVYGEAGRTQAEINAYYDGLMATAREHLRQRELAGADRSQLAAYIKMIARLERERAAATQQIEAEKKQAFHEFQRNFGQRVVGPLMSAPGAQSILGELRTTIQEVSNISQAIRVALGNGNPIDALVDQYTSKLEKFPQLQATVRQLGYAVGSELDRQLGGLAAQVEAFTVDPLTGLDEVTNASLHLDNILYDFEHQMHNPAPAIDPDSVAGQIVRVVGPNRSIDVAAEAYTNFLQVTNAMSGTSGNQKGPMRDRIRQQLLQQNIERLQQLVANPTHVTCTGVSREQYLLAVQHLGKEAEQPVEGEKVAYLVCSYADTETPFYAAMIGGGQVATLESTETVPSPTTTAVSVEPTDTQPVPEMTISPEGEDVTLTGYFTPDPSIICPNHDYKINSNQLEMSFNTGGGPVTGSGTFQSSCFISTGCSAITSHLNITFDGSFDPSGSATGVVTIRVQNTIVAGSECSSQTLNSDGIAPWQANYADGRMTGSFTVEGLTPMTFELSR